MKRHMHEQHIIRHVPNDPVDDEVGLGVQQAGVLRLNVVEVMHAVPTGEQGVLKAYYVRFSCVVLESWVSAVSCPILHQSQQTLNVLPQEHQGWHVSTNA